MAGIQQVTGTAVALERRDVDTDQIIPAAWLKRVERTGFAPGLFGAWRENPDFVLNRPGADRAKVLVAGTNFGCGSSREHAVWALQDFGFQAVVSARFADIFRGNCVSSGLVPVEIDEKIVSMLFDALRDDPDAEVVVDVAGRTIGIPAADISEPFALADFAQWRLLEGLDDVALTLRHEDAITAFEGGRPAWLPAVAPNTPASA
ncbi:MAG TPA: 3-isopropylmalate dehydratase small subunit [Streptosporangiaceae bacterium]|jgi:3-isopropylmalate/(R)-2-methylmalate dehydratase small subunit